MNTEKQQQEAAKEFAQRWQGKGYEKGESQRFWLDLLGNVYGIDKPTEYVEFEDKVQLDKTSFIDVMIPATHVMIEQKSLGKDLRKVIVQSDGVKLTPFQQAQRYSAALPYSQRPRWIVTCNFSEFDVYDMENPNGEPQRILLSELGTDYYRLQFLVDATSEHTKKEMEVSMKAGEIVGRIYDAFIKEYDPADPSSMRFLNILCVRLVFCLYAEDAGIFGKRDMFHDYLQQYDTMSMRNALLRLFDTLNTPVEKRSKYMRPDLAAFPYTNGGLFAEEIDIPLFTDEIRDVLLRHASLDFDWSQISPTIFGGVFESTLNPDTRRKGGMHYTSIENIHKVVDPLFLDSLKQEFESVKGESVVKVRLKRLHDFQDKLASLTFFDPACGSGNFLTETYLSLRRLENEVISEIYSIEPFDAFTNPIKVNINQIYGIEINDFAVTVATTALWISESQTLAETESIIHHDIDFLPLKSYANIKEGNALHIPWESVVPKQRLNYIIGNPPFVGFTFMSAEQKADMQAIFPGVKNLDYVCCWFKKANDFIRNTQIECALVSTNSITQGETVARFFPFLDFKINFAYHTFRWDNEAENQAHVHCVIIGFAMFDRKRKLIFDSNVKKEATNINAYLLDAPNRLVKSRNKPICNVPKMIYGNKPVDGGNLIINNYEEYIRNEPQAKGFIHPFLGAREFLHGEKRWCLWLDGVSPQILRSCPITYRRIVACKKVREQSVAAAIRKFAETPSLFAQRTQPIGIPFLLVPRVSSENRRYVPMGYVSPNIIVNDSVQIIPSATLYHFGVLESNVHMAWMRAVCGRLEMRYRYSKDVVYNNFPWPKSTPEQQAKIEQTAQAILEARKHYPDSSLADLYDPNLMPYDLLEAHRDNDRAVMAAYGFPVKMSETECVAKLFELYASLVKEDN